MDDAQKSKITEMQKLARQMQRALSEHGNAIAMGTEPTIVVFQANANPDVQGGKLSWHAGIVYRQHVASTPELALGSLGKTMLDVVARLAAEKNAGDEPVKELPGGGAPMIPGLGNLSDVKGE